MVNNYNKKLYGFARSLNITIKSKNEYLDRMENILDSRYGISNGRGFSQKDYSPKDFLRFLRDSEFHRLESMLNSFFDKANLFDLFNNQRVKELFERYKKIQSKIDLSDPGLYRKFKGDLNYLDSFNTDDYELEPSNLELKSIEEQIEKEKIYRRK